jgi:hypothetical protein
MAQCLVLVLSAPYYFTLADIVAERSTGTLTSNSWLASQVVQGQSLEQLRSRQGGPEPEPETLQALAWICVTPPWSADQNPDLLDATPGLPSELLDREHRESLPAELELKGGQWAHCHRNPGPVLLVPGCSRLVVGVVGDRFVKDRLCHL